MIYDMKWKKKKKKNNVILNALITDIVGMNFTANGVEASHQGKLTNVWSHRQTEKRVQCFWTCFTDTMYFN